MAPWRETERSKLVPLWRADNSLRRRATAHAHGVFGSMPILRILQYIDDARGDDARSDVDSIYYVRYYHT